MVNRQWACANWCEASGKTLSAGREPTLLWHTFAVVGGESQRRKVGARFLPRRPTLCKEPACDPYFDPLVRRDRCFSRV